MPTSQIDDEHKISYGLLFLNLLFPGFSSRMLVTFPSGLMMRKTNMLLNMEERNGRDTGRGVPPLIERSM